MSTATEKKSRNNAPGVRLIGGRIYDSDNGKTCHQCRQKTRDFTASCKNLKVNKVCPINFCHKCLLNRYGEKADEVDLLEVWSCPKCRGICNCSFCMKKRGHKPTGLLVHTAKGLGFSSVSEMIEVKGSGLPDKKSAVVMTRKPGKENAVDGNVNSDVESVMEVKPDHKNSKKGRERGLVERTNSGVVDNAGVGRKGMKKPKINDEVHKEELTANGKSESVLPKEIKQKTIPNKGRKRKCKGTGASADSKTDNFCSKDEAEPAMKTCKVSYVQTDVENGDWIGELNADMEPSQVNDDKDCFVAAGDELKRTTDPSDQNGITRNNDKAMRNTVSTESQNSEFDLKLQLPQGSIVLTTVADVELAPENVGHALQFLEFLTAFGKALNLKKGQRNVLIREIIHGQSGRRSQYTILPWIHIQLLSVILKDTGERSPSLKGKNPWLQALGQFVSDSQIMSSELPPNCFNGDIEEYEKLTTTNKLKILNFLCDEALGTDLLRNWIDDQNFKVQQKEKEAKKEILAATEKEKSLKKKLQDELAKAVLEKNGAALSISQHESLVSRIKSEAAEAHRETLEAKGMLPKKRQRSDAVRTEPIILEGNGHVLWKLKCYTTEPSVLLQDLGTLDSVAPCEKWFSYDDGQKQELDKYITSLNTKRSRLRKTQTTFQDQPKCKDLVAASP